MMIEEFTGWATCKSCGCLYFARAAFVSDHKCPDGSGHGCHTCSFRPYYPVLLGFPYSPDLSCHMCLVLTGRETCDECERRPSVIETREKFKTLGFART